MQTSNARMSLNGSGLIAWNAKSMRHAQRLAAEFECVVRERLDNSRGIAAIRDRLRLEQDVHTEEIARLHAEIDSLTQQLKAAVTATHENSSSELAQRMSAQQSELNRLVIEHDLAVVDRDRAGQELAQTENNVQAYETSQRALEDAASRLRSQNTRLEQRVTNLQAQLRQQTLHVQHQLDRSHVERDRDCANTTEAALQSTFAKLQSANAERDRARANLQTNQSQIAAPASGRRNMTTPFYGVTWLRLELPPTRSRLSATKQYMIATPFVIVWLG
ncbi:hypothetical protein KRP22_004503 [Phytophthora ramorum]|nr:hypothetical protein KRP22_14332 [Phytophthora ramorum]